MPLTDTYREPSFARMSDPPWRILVTEPYSVESMAKLKALGEVQLLAAPDEQSLLAAVSNCDALLVRTATRVSRRVIEAAPRLRVIGRGGVGLDNIDLDAARDEHITVVYTPNAATQAVADLTFALMLGLIWQLNGHDHAVRTERFMDARSKAAPRELKGLTLGIVGMGRIGQAVARRAVNGFLMEVLYTDILELGDLGLGARQVGAKELFQRSDVVSLHVPLTHATRNMVDREAIRLFKNGAILINTSRGAVVESEAVAEGLRTGKLWGAGFDVFEVEPPRSNDALLSAPNTLLTPHIGARTALAQENMNAVVDDVIAVLQGRQPRFPWVG